MEKLMEPVVGIAGEDFIQAGYALLKFLKEAGNYDNGSIEFCGFKRWADMYLYDYCKEDNARIGVAFTIFRERWNGSIYNINIPLIYAVLEAPQFEYGSINQLWDITVRRHNPVFRCYRRDGNDLIPLDLQVPQLMTDRR
jgi:hypothetical protein